MSRTIACFINICSSSRAGAESISTPSPWCRTVVSLRGLAGEVRGIVRAAGAFVLGNLRIGAQWPRSRDLAIGNTRCNDLLGRLSFLYPLLERGDHVEAIWTFATAAGSHSRDHKQTYPIGGLRTAAHFVQHALVVMDGRQRRHILIAPAVIHQKLAAVLRERRKVGVDRIDRAIVDLVGESNVGLDIKRPPIPIWILEDDVLELIDIIWVWLRSSRLGGPAELGAQ